MATEPEHSEITKLFSIEFGEKHTISLPMNALQASVFPVVLIKDSAIRSIGTAFAISPHGLCMTAKHVIDEAPMIENPDDPRSPIIDGALGIIYITPPKDSADTELFGGFIPIVNAHTIDGIDVGLLFLNVPILEETGEPVPMPIFRLKLELPKGDERLLAIGYDEGNWDAVGITRTLTHSLKATTGFVRTVHPAGRDRALMPTPCYETSACFRPGMSGGPVLDEDGFGVGVISTGFAFVEGEEPLSYASPVGVAMGLTLSERDHTGTEKMNFLWDFATSPNSAIKVEAGNAIIERTATELFIRTGGMEYHAILGS